MAVFSLVHASDLHIGVRPDFTNGYDAGSYLGWFKQAFSREIAGSITPSTFWPDVASRFTHEMDQLAEELDAIIITGDIATTGSKADVRAAADFIKGVVPSSWVGSERAFRPLVADFLPPVILMPGNHDRYEPPSLRPQSLEFETAFGPCWDFSPTNTGQFAHHRFAHTVEIQKDDCSLVICTVDFSLPDLSDALPAGKLGLGYLGQGIVKRKQNLPYAKLTPLDELVQQTEWAKENIENCSVVWCVHFPPAFPSIASDMQLIDEHYLIDAAEELGIKIILSGHTHVYRSYLARSGLRVICCGTTTAKSTSSGHQYLRLEIDTNNMFNPKVIPKRYDFALKRFV